MRMLVVRVDLVLYVWHGLYNVHCHGLSWFGLCKYYSFYYHALTYVFCFLDTNDIFRGYCLYETK